MKTLNVFKQEEITNIQQNMSCRFSVQIDADILKKSSVSCEWLKHLKLRFASHLWNKITGISSDEAMKNFMLFLMNINPCDMMNFYMKIYDSFSECTLFRTIVRYHYHDGNVCRLQITMKPYSEGSQVISDGLIQTLF